MLPDRIPYDHDDDPVEAAPQRLDGSFWLGVGLIAVFAAGVVHIGELALSVVEKLL